MVRKAVADSVVWVLVVPMACCTDRLPSATRFTVPPVKLIGPVTDKSLPVPVMLAETWPAPEMVLDTVVSAARRTCKLALLDSVTLPLPKVPVLPALPTWSVPPLTVVVPL